MAKSRKGFIPGGVGEAMAVLGGRMSTAILKYPSGRFGLVGSIPVELTEPEPKAFSPGQRRSMAWDTEQEVIDALLAIGCTKFQLADCSWYQPPVDAQPEPVSPTAGMSDKEIHDYYKRTAPVEDVKFWLRLNLPTPVHEACVALSQTLDARKGKASPETKAAYRRIQQMYRESTVVYTGTAPAGEKGWHIYYRNAKGETFMQQGKKMVPVTSYTNPAIIRPMPEKTKRQKTARVDDSGQACSDCQAVQDCAPDCTSKRMPRERVQRPRTKCSKCGNPAAPEEFGSRTDCRPCRQAYRQQRKTAA